MIFSLFSLEGSIFNDLVRLFLEYSEVPIVTFFKDNFMFYHLSYVFALIRFEGTERKIGVTWPFVCIRYGEGC